MQWREKGAGGSISQNIIQKFNNKTGAGGSISYTQNILSQNIIQKSSTKKFKSWGQNLVHSKSSTTTKNGMENKMTKKGEGGWGHGQHLSKYYKKSSTTKKGASFTNATEN